MYLMKVVAQKTGVTPSALRYYEKEDILPFVKRDENGLRIYDDVNLEWIYFIKALRATDMPIREIKEYVRLYKAGEETFYLRKQLLEKHQANVEEKLKSQAKYLERIKYKLKSYDKIEENLGVPNH